MTMGIIMLKMSSKMMRKKKRKRMIGTKKQMNAKEVVMILVGN